MNNQPFIPPVINPVEAAHNFVLPRLERAKAQSAMLIPISHELIGQSKLILKGVGLALLKPKLFVIDTKKAGEEQTAYAEGVGIDTYDKKSSLFGLPVFDTLTFEQDAYTDEFGQDIPAQRYTLDIALMEVTQNKNIVVTKVAGKSGTIKEYMSDGDYNISISSVLANDLISLLPAKALSELARLCEAPITLQVNSAFLGFFNIYSLVITNYTIKQREGERNVVDVHIDCLSDTPFEIEQAK